MFAQVYINTLNIALDKPFHYYIPARLLGEVAPGVRVRVPFGRGDRKSEGIVTGITDASEFDNVKEISSVLDKMPSLTKRDIDLCLKMRDKYYCTFYAAARLFLPAGSADKKEEWVSLAKELSDEEKKKNLKSAVQEKLYMMLDEASGTLPMSAIKAEMGKNARQSVTTLAKRGILSVSEKSIKRVDEKTVRVAYYASDEEPHELCEKLLKRSPAQARVVELLADGEAYAVSDIVSLCKCAHSSIEALELKGVIAFDSVRVMRDPFSGKEREKTTPFLPTEEQRTAIDIINSAGEGTILIRGVTGSGKTEVYLQAVEKVISEGKQAIVLVPEISLTPQITDRFYKRFGRVVALMHSALSLGERFDEYKRIESGEAKVVVGARSAVFAPCKSLGIIIIDEEHEYSYKSETTPKYHAIEIAKLRCEKAKCPLVLSSATPSAESYYKAKSGEYTLVELKERYNKNPLPEVKIEDMRDELSAGNKTVLSRRLAREMYENLKRGEQTILFLNRRGYSTFVSCRSCGFVYMCPDCSVSLTYHSVNDTLNCHICGYRQRRDSFCPECGSDRIRDFGTGTQKVERQIQEIFPTAELIRMDLDTTGGKRGHEKILEAFEKENKDILLGTQMVSKGLDFPNVTLVGALAADSSLYSNDFRAQERTFSLITQVAGRAGRGDTPGRAVIQTYSPENRVLNLAARQDYETFYNEEIEYRRVFGYPPFLNIVNITVSADAEDKAEAAAELAYSELRISSQARQEEIKIYGPMDAPIKKIQGRFRKRIWFKCKEVDEFSEVFRAILSKKREGGVQIAIDVNPYSMG